VIEQTFEPDTTVLVEYQDKLLKGVIVGPDTYTGHYIVELAGTNQSVLIAQEDIHLDHDISEMIAVMVEL